MMKNKSKGRPFGRFDVKQKLKKDSYNQYRLYYLIATIVSPFFSFLVFDEASSLKNIYTDLTIPILFLVIGIWSFYNESIKKNLKYIFFIYCLFLSIYAYLIYADSGYTINNFLGFMIAFFAIMIGLNDHRLSLLYSVFCLGIIGVSHLIWLEGKQPINILTELTALGIIGIVGFVIHYNSYKALKTILYNEGLLSNILNSTGDGMLLLDDTNTVLDLNKKAKELFKIDTNKTLIGTELNGIFNPKDILSDKHEFTRSDKSTFICEVRKNNIEYQGWKYTIFVLVDITESLERKKELDTVKSQLVESERTYRELFDNSIDLFFVIDQNLNIIDVNRQVLILSEQTNDFFLNKSFLELLNSTEADELSLWLKSKDSSLKTAQIFNQLFDLNIRKTSYYDKEHYVISARSAENRIKYENILKESRDQMIMILENINSIIYFQEVNEDKSVRLRYLSPKIETLLGISVDEFITLAKANKVDQIIHPDDREMVNAKRALVLEKSISVEFTYRAIKGNGYVWMEDRVYPKFDSQGKHIANFGITTDVTKAKENQDALEFSHKQNRDFIDRNLAGFYRMDTNRTILDCNDSFAKIFGFNLAVEIIGKNVNEIYKDSTDRESFVKNLKLNKRVINNESKITLINNKIIWILENASLIESNNSDIIESTVFEITDLKEAEFALEKSEETLSMILNNIEDLIYNVEFNPDGTRQFNYLGNQVEKITGLTKEEYIKHVTEKTVAELIYPEDLPDLILKSEIMKDEKRNQVFQYRFKSNRGLIWIEENVFPQFDQLGNIIRIFGVVRETTEKKKFEEALISSEERYRTLFEKNMAGVFRTTLDGKMIEFNNAFVNIFGYTSKEELLNLSSKDLYFNNEDRENYILELKKEGNLFNYELLHKRKDNSILWVLANVSLISGSSPETGYIQGTLVDITQLKATSEALKENEEKFRLLFEATNDAIFILNNDLIVDCNDKSLETFGCSVEEKEQEMTMGTKLYEMSPKFQPDGNPSYEKFNIKIKDVLDGNSQMFYWRFMRKDGVPFDAEVSLNSFQLNNKSFIQAIVRDITARLKAEVALRESEDRFKMLSNATIEGIIFTEEGVIIDSNEQFALMYGFDKRNEVIGKNINDFLFSESEIIKVKNIIDSSSEEKFEVKSKKKNGEVIWVESKGRMIPYHGRRLRVSVVYDITDRKLKEQQLQDSRESFMNLTELSPNGSIIHVNGIIHYANPVVLKFLGYSTAEELIGKNIINLLPADQQSRSKERIQQISNGGVVGFTEYNIKNKKGDFIDIGVQSVRLVYNGKEAIHVILSNLSQQKELQKEKLRAQLAEETNALLEKEILERKETEQRLWETQMFTTNMFNSSLDMIMASDRNNLITQVNNSVLKTFGYSTQEVIGLHPKDLYASEEDFDVVRLSLLDKGIFSGEIKNIRKNGETFISFLSASVLRNTQGKIIGTMGISRDITESLRSQQKIREQDAKIRSIFDNAANMLIWTIDTNYCLLSFNHNFTQVLKTYFDIEPKIGMSMAEIIKPLLSQELYDYSIQSFEKTFSGKTSELEGPFKTKNNQTIWIETFLNPILMEGGIIKEISCISHEITEKKASESQIRQSLKEKEVLLKEVHHRVKNNLQVISSILNLQSSYVKDDQILSVLRESQNRIKSMSYIHESLYQTKNFSSINFSEYIVNLSNNLFHSYQIFDNFIELKLKVDPVNLNLDQAIPCGLIVNELITNALKYAFKNKKAGEIFIAISEKGKTISIRIEDNGVGLPEGFNYLKTETLGLQLVVTLVEQLDGKLELKSEKGTKYLITFDKLN
jgi:PAS domain S-box-containing protein